MCSICTTTATTTTKPQRKFYWANSKTAETKVKLALQSLCSASFAQHRSLSLTLFCISLSHSGTVCDLIAASLSFDYNSFACSSLIRPSSPRAVSRPAFCPVSASNSPRAYAIYTNKTNSSV